MNSLIIILGILLSAPTAHNFFGEIPEDIPTFKIKFQRDQTEHFGALRVQEGWIRDTSPTDLKTKAVDIVIDTPWVQPQPQRRELGQKIDISYEAPALRKKRLEEGWKKAGFAIIDTPQGKKTITVSEYKNAVNMIKKANEIYSLTKLPQLYYSPIGKDISFENRSIAFLKLWWPHIVILATGGISLTSVIFYFFLHSTDKK